MFSLDIAYLSVKWLPLTAYIILELVLKHNYFSDHGHTTFQVTKGFLECLQEASEAYLTFSFVDLN